MSGESPEKSGLLVLGTMPSGDRHAMPSGVRLGTTLFRMQNMVD